MGGLGFASCLSPSCDQETRKSSGQPKSWDGQTHVCHASLEPLTALSSQSQTPVEDNPSDIWFPTARMAEKQSGSQILSSTTQVRTELDVFLGLVAAYGRYRYGTCS